MAAKGTSKHQVLELAPRRASRDAIEALEDLLDAARAGKVIGVAYVALKPGGKDHYVDAAGECRAHPTLTRGMLRTLDDALAKLLPCQD